MVRITTTDTVRELQPAFHAHANTAEHAVDAGKEQYAVAGAFMRDICSLLHSSIGDPICNAFRIVCDWPGLIFAEQIYNSKADPSSSRSTACTR